MSGEAIEAGGCAPPVIVHFDAMRIGPSDRAIAQAFREWQVSPGAGVFKANASAWIEFRAAAIDAIQSPAGARDAVANAATSLRSLAEVLRRYGFCAPAALETVAERLEATQPAPVVGGDARLEELAYVPGAWRCPKCGLRLMAQTLHIQDGGMSANNEPQACANGCGPMWRVTEREDRQDAQRFAIEQSQKLEALLAARPGGEGSLSQDELFAGMRELNRRIEACGASPELTHAVTLSSDIGSAIGNKWNPASAYAAERVRAVLPAKPKATKGEE